MRTHPIQAIVALVTFGTLFSACASDRGEDAIAPKTVAPQTKNWSVKSYRKEDGTSRLRHHYPVPVTSLSEVSTGTSMPQRSTMVRVEKSTEEPYDIGSWALLREAAAECGHPDQDTITAPWALDDSTGDYSTFIFQGRMLSCDDLLRRQETTLCVADKLAEIADAIAPIYWDNGNTMFPPQADHDKFILRDLSIYTLANLSLLDTVPARVIESGRDCSILYSRIAATGGDAESNSVAFGSNVPPRYFAPRYDDAVLSGAQLALSAQERLKHKTHIFRSGAQLLHELIEKSVQADMSGSVQRKSKSTEPLRGSKQAWLGIPEEGDYYNSLAHAVRVVAGRWELAPAEGPMGIGGVDHQCSGLVAEKIINAYGDSNIKSRTTSIDVQTEGQQRAVALLEEYGIVIPQVSLDGDFASLRSAIRQQVVATAAHRLKYTVTNQFLNDSDFVRSGAGNLLSTRFDSFSDADLTFAIRHNWNTYRLLTGTEGAASVNDVQQGGGGLTSGDVPQFLEGYGLGLDKAMPRTDLLVDAVARTGGIMVASQCEEPGGPDDLIGPSRAVRYPLQDSFTSAQAMQQSLVLLREVMNEINPAPATPWDAQKLAPVAVAEVESWAGPGRVVGWATSVREPVVDSLRVQVIGLTPKDVGVNSYRTMGDEFALVWGPAWVAECAARLRKNCPDNFEADYVAHPSQVVDSYHVKDPSYDTISTYLTDGGIVDLRFDSTDFPARFSPRLSDGLSRDNLYVVQLHHADGREGRVLGSLAVRTRGAGFAVSNLQRQLANGVLAMPEATASGGDCQIGSRGYSETRDYCVRRGVSPEVFVPLENELTSDSDQYENSWKHYLQLARIAADRADQLAQELIQQGLQQDLRREAALEEVGRLCGTYGTSNEVTINADGEVEPAGASGGDEPAGISQGIANCISPEKYDIVFLVNDPYAGLDDSTATDKIKEEVLRCQETGDAHRLCKSDVINITHASLNLSESAPKPTVDCGSAYQAMDSMVRQYEFDPNFVYAAIKEDYFRSANIASSLQAVRLSTQEDGGWSLFSGGRVLMDSHGQPKFWPGCRRAGQTCPADQENLYFIYDVMFRRRQGELGISDQALGDPFLSNEDNEAGFIRRRLEGALWLLGSWGGYMPRGLFSTYLPASNVAESVMVDGNPLGQAVLPTIYGASGFDNGHVTSGNIYNRATLTDNITSIGTALPFTTWSGLRSQDYPDPQSGIIKAYYPPYQYSVPPVMIPARNVGYAIHQKQEGILTSIAQAANGFAGIMCHDGAGKSIFEEQHSDQGTPYDKAMGRVAAWKYLGFGTNKPTSPTGTDPNSGMLSCKDWSSCFSQEINGAFFEPGEEKQTGIVSRGQYGKAVIQPSGVKRPFSLRLSDVGDFLDPNSLGSIPCLKFKEHVPGYYAYDVPQVYDNCVSLFDAVQDSSAEFLGIVPNGPSGQPCRQASTNMFPDFNLECLKDDVEWKFFRYSDRFLWPSSWAPDERVPVFINSDVPGGACESITSTVQAIYMACAIQNMGSGAEIPSQPKLDGIEDIPLLVGWMDSLRQAAEAQTTKIYFESIPRSVVDQFAQGTLNSPATAGTFATQTVNLRGSLETMHNGWHNISSALSLLENGIKNVNNEIAAADLAQNKAMNAIAIQRLQLQIQQASAIAQAFSACSPTVSGGLPGSFSVSFSPGACLAQAAFASTSMSLTSGINSKLSDAAVLEEKDKNNKIATAINHLDQITVVQNKVINDALDLQIRQGAAQTLALLTQLRSTEVDATYQLAKAAGADYAKFDDGSGNPVVVDYPVNTVLRRQYDVTKLRYERALSDAKYMAYIARRAIEQRIGMRLSTIDSPVGPFEAPSQWADDVCQLQGVDYKKLRTGTPLEGQAGTGSNGGDSSSIDEFADQYVGDYVSKLEKFVEAYNITYPSHDGDDLVVLSLRDDLMGSAQSCTKESPNLLYYSSHLDQGDSITEPGGESSRRGWALNPCNQDGSECLIASPGEVVTGHPEGPPGSGNAPYTWLRLVSAGETVAGMGGTGGTGGTSGASASGAGTGGSTSGAGGQPGSAGASGNASGGAGGVSGTGGSGGQGGQAGTSAGTASSDQNDPEDVAPTQIVYQTLQLSPGHYRLSWWDQRRSMDGRCLHLSGDPAVPQEPDCEELPSTESSAPYRVTLYSGQWVPLNSFLFEPAIGKWSDRRTSVDLVVDSTDEFTVAFQLKGGVNAGSLLLGGVQLEALNSPDAAPGPYIDTLSSRLYITSACSTGRTQEDVQKAFTYSCNEKEGCFYELSTPFTLDTKAIASGQSRLKGRIAAGNFNYRHVDLGLNLAGTGLIDCKNVPGNSCYGSGYAEYTLTHDAFRAGILNYEGNQQCFSFGSASINHGKAIAAERYMTTPLGSADQSLLSQPSITKIEMRGRPLDGTYTLRIWDQPGLRWDHLEDVQFVLKYRYWSPIAKQATN